MIKVLVEKGKVIGMLCDCGNKHDFAKYVSVKLERGERNRWKEVPVTGIACLRKSCGAILMEEELNKQLGAAKFLEKDKIL